MNPTSKSSRTEKKIVARMSERKPRGLKKNRNMTMVEVNYHG